ncbi:protein FAM83C-like [Arapaima gigas]
MINSESLRPTPNPGRKALGKLASRLEEVKNPWRHGSTLELSHNEAARLATDALLEHGEKEYRRVLDEERELSFLSSLEIKFITDHAACSGDADTSGGAERDCGDGDAVSELTSGTYFPMMSDEEPPVLELGWPDLPVRHGPSETQIYFQRDKSHNVKDLIRSLINKAKKAIALVMDLFTDVDLLCDLMEASNKRRVPVYILLDEKNLSYFIDMCKALDVNNSHLSNMRVRSVSGETYCTKSGKKFTGQVQEKFLIIDCEEVIAGSYSFTWLSAQVHSNMVLHFSGGVAESFDHEFRCLYADSQIISYFHNPDEDELPHYAYSFMSPNMGLDVLHERPREKVRSEHSSSQSSNSVSSIKKAPAMYNAVYKVELDKKEPSSTFFTSDRRCNQQGVRGSPGSPVHSSVTEHHTSGAGPAAGVEWSRVAPLDSSYGANVGGTTSKMQALGLYDQKKNNFHSTSKSPPPMDSKSSSKNKNSANPILNKISDFFSAPGKDSYMLRKSPPQSMAFSGPDLSQTEPESTQPLPAPAPMMMERRMNRHDQKRLTLGHSKLDLVNHYNKIKTKQVYSRFELKNNN